MSRQVTAALRGHLGHVGTCERGCAALGNLTFKNPDNQTLAAQCSSIEAVASAMRSHISASSVQERGAAALGAQAMPVKWGGAQPKKKTTLSIAPAESIFQLRTTAVCAGNIGFRNPANQKRIAQCGGVELIVDAIGKFGEHRGVQEQGFRALRNLAVRASDAALLCPLRPHLCSARSVQLSCVVVALPDSIVDC